MGIRKTVLDGRLRPDRLEAFYETIMEGTEEKAAVKLDLDASTVRKRNLKLQEAWKTELLKRYGKWKRSELTKDGEMVFELAKQSVEAFDRVKSQNLQDMIQYEEKRLEKRDRLAKVWLAKLRSSKE